MEITKYNFHHLKIRTTLTNIYTSYTEKSGDFETKIYYVSYLFSKVWLKLGENFSTKTL